MMAMSDTDMHELAVERVIDAPVAAVWRAWTDHLAEWWCPRPWTTEVVEIDLRAGGRMATIMRGPGGEEHALEGVFLEVEPMRRIVFTDAYRVGWIPQTPFMTGLMELEPEDKRTRYVGRARHWSTDAMSRHDAMGFDDGWGRAAAQLEEVARELAMAQG